MHPDNLSFPFIGKDGYIECISYSLIENQSYPGRTKVVG